MCIYSLFHVIQMSYHFPILPHQVDRSLSLDRQKVRECKPSKEDLEEEEEDVVEEDDESEERTDDEIVEKVHISFLNTYWGRTVPEPNRFAMRLWEGHQAR